MVASVGIVRRHPPKGDVMQTHPTPAPATRSNATTATPPRATDSAPLHGIERLMADAVEAAARNPTIDPGAIEYASWLRLLRRPTP